MRNTPVEEYLEEISTTLSEETYGRLSDAIYETNCEFDEEVASYRAENAKLRKERDTLCHRIDELCREVESLRHTAKRIVVSDGGVGHAECGACGGAIDQDDAWCRHCGARLEGE